MNLHIHTCTTNYIKFFFTVNGTQLQADAIYTTINYYVNDIVTFLLTHVQSAVVTSFRIKFT